MGSVVMTPVENEVPTGEHRWDSSGASAGSSSPPWKIIEDDEKGSPSGQFPETFPGEEEYTFGRVKPIDDETAEVSVASDDSLPSVGARQPEEEAVHGLDGTLTLAAAATTFNEEERITPAHTPLFCGCFGI